MFSSQKIQRLTAPGRGAVAVIRLNAASGQSLDECFVAANGHQVSAAAVGRILYGQWSGEDVVVVRTGATEWEINCHGGEAAVRRIQNDLSVSSVPIGEAVDESSKLEDALTAELIQCRSRRTAEYLLAQCEGVFESFVANLRRSESTSAAVELVNDVLQWREFAEHLVEPWKIAIVGQPNAGKSSLLNALIGYERAIVFEEPGTTRDRVEAELMLDGWPFLAIDTAGIRDTCDAVETLGVEYARDSILDCDLCLLVVDATVGWTADDLAIFESVEKQTPIAVLFNKIDLLQSEVPDSGSDAHQFHISATLNKDLDSVLRWIPETLVPQIPSTSQPLPVLDEFTCELQDFRQTRDLAALQRSLDSWLSE